MADKYKAVIEWDADLKKLNAKLDKLQKSVTGAGKKGKKAGSMISSSFVKAGISMAGVYLTAKKVFNDWLKPAIALQTQMANVHSLTTMSTEALAKMTVKVQELSRNIPKTSAELASGLYQVISAGVDTAHTYDVLNASARASVAGVASVTDALGLGSAVVKAYGMEWSQFESVQDQAFKTVELGQTTFGELAQSMQRVTGQGKTLGITTQELFGSFATLTGVTGNTAEVSTQLRGIFTGLIKPKDKLIALAKKLGFASIEQMTKQKGLIGVLKILKEETGGSALKMGELFESSEALTALLPMTSTLMDTLTEKTGKITEATGSMNEAYKKQMETWENQVKIFQNRMKPVMVGFVAGMTDALKSVNKFIEVPMSKTLEKDRIEFKSMTKVIRDANLPIGERTKLISTLNTNYGDYLDNIIDEKTSYDELTIAIKKADEQFMVMIQNKVFEEQQQELTDDLAEIATAIVNMTIKIQEYKDAGADFTLTDLVAGAGMEQDPLTLMEQGLSDLNTQFQSLIDKKQEIKELFLSTFGYIPTDTGVPSTAIDEEEGKKEETFQRDMVRESIRMQQARNIAMEKLAFEKNIEASKKKQIALDKQQLSSQEQMASYLASMSASLLVSAISGDKIGESLKRAVLQMIMMVVQAKIYKMIMGSASMGPLGFLSGFLGFHQGGAVLHRGGMVKMHSGGLRPDETSAILKKGEFVINDQAVKQIGLSNLNHMNLKGEIPQTQQGMTQIIQIGKVLTTDKYWRDVLSPVATETDELGLS